MNKQLLSKNFRKKTKSVVTKPIVETVPIKIPDPKPMSDIFNEIGRLFCDDPLDFVIEKQPTKSISTLIPSEIQRKIDENWLNNTDKSIRELKQCENGLEQDGGDNFENIDEIAKEVNKKLKNKSERVKRLKRTNFVKIDLRKKVYVRGKSKFNFKKMKFNTWKMRKAQNRANAV